MKFSGKCVAMIAALACPGTATSAEPNETFATATLLAAGVASVSDLLTPGEASIPDTYLGIRNSSGTITLTDDNGSLIGSPTASGLQGVATNLQSVSFSVTGVGDALFSGAHTQSGQYEVFVDVFSSNGAPVASRNEVRTLQAGQINSFQFNGTADWIGGTYDVNIDNLLSEPTGGDVDFFTFAGLAPGGTFRAETSDPASGINTFLYWYNSAGAVVGIDDNSGVGGFSLLKGTVPGDGRLTFAVTGFGDIDNGMPVGAHRQDGTYQLSVLSTPALSADFNKSGAVNAADLGVWTASFGVNAGADADLDLISDGHDFLTWQRQLGGGAAVPAGRAVPEPSAWALLALAGMGPLMLYGPSCMLSRRRSPCCCSQ